MTRIEPPRTLRVRRPFYPALAAFVAACFVGLLATDLAYWATADMMWSDFSAWLVSVGVVVGWLTVVVTLVEVFAVRTFRPRPSWLWTIGSIVALIVATFDMLIHTRDAWTSVVPWGLVLSAIVVLVLLVTACLDRPRYDVARAEVTP